MTRTNPKLSACNAKVSAIWSKMRVLTAQGSDVKSWYAMAQRDDTAEIRIYEEIGYFGVTAKQFVQDLQRITAKRITVALNTPGGDVFDGLAIYNALKAFPGTVETRVDGLAASIGSLIAMAGERIVMKPGSLMMLHKPWAIAIGNAVDMRALADTLDKVENSLVGIYVARSGKTADEVKAILEADTWLSADEAVDEGFATDAEEPQEPKQESERKNAAASAAAASDPTRPRAHESHEHRTHRHRRLRLAEAY
ncbi:MAG: Clp protease ClpP [Nitrospiraceae bacterium]